MILEKEKNITLITHLSGFGSYFFPLGSVIISFIIRGTKKQDSKFMDALTKDVVNFNLSYLLYTILIKLLIIPLSVGSFLENIFINRYSFHFEGDFDTNQIFGLVSFGSLLTILVIVKFVLIIQAAIKTNNGEVYKYPYIISFIK